MCSQAIFLMKWTWTDIEMKVRSIFTPLLRGPKEAEAALYHEFTMLDSEWKYEARNSGSKLNFSIFGAGETSPIASIPHHHFSIALMNLFLY